MKRRAVFTCLAGTATTSGLLLASCGDSAEEPNKAAPAGASGAATKAPAAGGSAGTPAPVTALTADPKAVSKVLLPKLVALIDAINSKDAGKIATTKKELQQEADKSDEAVRASTGQAANQVNAALNNIRLAGMSNDIKTLERAKTLLEEAMK
ncbi:MAG: hypothetical protein EXR45_03435 [Chloroflexi bacterium]|nr:hypothetical protein [Chloroflexota bacterium]